MEQIEETRFLVELFDWKSGVARNLPPIVCVMGGTGTGKSTIFNSLVSSDISSVSVKRPCTMNAIILANASHRDILFQAPFVFGGEEAQAQLITQPGDELNSFILVDTPDFDSIAEGNKTIAQKFLMLSDVVIFVTSQEKYGDLICRRTLEQARDWGKKILLVMNKVTSQAALEEYSSFTGSLGTVDQPIVIPRLTGMPNRIDKLTDQPQFSRLFTDISGQTGSARIKSHELDCLKSRTVSDLEKLLLSIQGQIDRISELNRKIDTISEEAALKLNKDLDAIVSQDVEKRMKSRLQSLLRKYDILFVPRLMIRNAFNTLIGYVSGYLSFREKNEAPVDDKEIRFEDFSDIQSLAPLGPLDQSVTNLNLGVAQILASSPVYDDLRLIALKDVDRLSLKTIKGLYEEAFPGLEEILETEFEKIRQGLTRYDEIKLYGSYTLWAVLLITFEIVIGGGLTLLDLLLNSVIVPFIPKWLLDLKILDILRAIAEKVDAEHRACLRNILFKQARLYTECFASLTPDQKAVSEIELLKLGISHTRP